MSAGTASRRPWCEAVGLTLIPTFPACGPAADGFTHNRMQVGAAGCPTAHGV